MIAELQPHATIRNSRIVHQEGIRQVTLDRPPTRNEVAKLHSRSSQATITAPSFLNEYNWGDLKADPSDWMRRYFGASVYTANWCNCRLALRLPRSGGVPASGKRYRPHASACSRDRGQFQPRAQDTRLDRTNRSSGSDRYGTGKPGRESFHAAWPDDEKAAQSLDCVYGTNVSAGTGQWATECASFPGI